ncbi:MAG: hypothetical protein MSG64_19140 [Pyrinomonadaceae bacterium MAG19_C2-C3]|nr:hypothetical protein [Pyrinomonadaceae bacterium MAG19_C2-C3]
MIDTSPQLGATQYTSTKKLQSGVIYNWEVTTVIDGVHLIAPDQTSGMVKFKVLAPERFDYVRRKQQELGSTHIALGVMYAREGLIEDAEREFRLFAAKNPKSEVARRLLRITLSLRRIKN